MILAIGNSHSFDLESMQCVQSYLLEQGEDAILFSQDKCLEGEGIRYRLNSSGSTIEIIIGSEWHNIADFTKIWMLKPFLPKELIKSVKPEMHWVIYNQFKALRDAIAFHYPNKIKLNHPVAAHRANNKPYQLTIAYSVGLLVPDTHATSEPDDVSHLHGLYDGALIAKILAPSQIQDKVFYTKRVDDSFLSRRKSVRYSPILLQREVAKSYELRITYVRGQLYTAKIDSQIHEDTRVDWRRRPGINDFNVPMTEYDLPSHIQNKLCMFMDKMGLDFGCIDMVRTPSGEYVFLEVNENGQWYFVQLNTHMDIARGIAKLLV